MLFILLATDIYIIQASVLKLSQTCPSKLAEQHNTAKALTHKIIFSRNIEREGSLTHEKLARDKEVCKRLTRQSIIPSTRKVTDDCIL